ncbi:MAG: (d)CMP kinase, partial [Victivallales bacterium]|nr:(d)CMP kinase [Victivallales bacterium]
VVFPDARYKFYLTATPEVRARRRLAQNGEAGEGATVESVAKEIARRDDLDMTRETSPLKKADDAVLIDSSDMTVEEILDMIISKVKRGVES